MNLYKPEEKVARAGTYIEVGHGGGKIKRKDAKIVELKENDAFPALAPYEVSRLHKGETRTKARQHKWQFLK